MTLFRPFCVDAVEEYSPIVSAKRNPLGTVSLNLTRKAEKKSTYAPWLNPVDRGLI